MANRGDNYIKLLKAEPSTAILTLTLSLFVA